MPKISEFRITKEAVDSLPTDKDAIYWDSATRGFGVRVKPGGKKSYVVQYRNADGASKRSTLGQHGALTPKEAEKLAKALLGKVAGGEDPAGTDAEHRKAMTVKELCELYLKAAEAGKILGKGRKPKKVSTLATDRGRITRHILPLLGTKKVRSLTTTAIIKFMEDVQDGKTAADVKTKARGRAIVEGGAGTAARTVGLLGGILTYAVRKGVIDANPCRSVDRPASKKRRIRLSPEQYRVLGKALVASEQDGDAWQGVAGCRLLALTGCRLGEVQNLKTVEIDTANRALRLLDSKEGESVRPLPSAAIAVLGALPRTNSRWVFPAIKLKDGPYGSLPKAWKRITARTVAKEDPIGLTWLTLHGLRHAFASTAGDLGFSTITVAGMLGHAAGGTTEGYIHLDSALIAAADRVAARIDAYMTGREDGAEVVPLRRA